MNFIIKNISISILLIFIINTSLYSQKSFFKSADNFIVLSPILMRNTSDGGWVTVTSTPTFNSNNDYKGILVIKYSKCSTIEWSKYFYYSYTPIAISDFIIEANGNIMILGYSCFFDSCSINLIYLSPDGNIIWNKRGGGGTSSAIFIFAYSIGKTDDGNFFIYGIENLSNYIIKFNSNCSVIWSNKYFENPIWGEAIAVESGNILVRSGNLIYKVNSSGSMIWAKRFSGLQYTCKPIINNNGYTYVNYPSSAADNNCFAFNINTSGEIMSIGTAFSGNSVGKIKKLDNGNLLIIGNSKDDFGNYKAVLIETTLNGTIVSQRLIENINAGAINNGYDFITLNDNSLVISAANINDSKLFLIKTDENQNLLCGERTINNTNTAPFLDASSELSFSQPFSVSFGNIAINVKNVTISETSYCFIPNTMNLNLGNDTTICAKQTIVLKSNILGNYSYLWSTGETTPQITVSNEGTYWLRVIGCDTVADTIRIKYTPPFAINYKISPLSINLEESILFTNYSLGYTNYYWETGDGSKYTQNEFEHIYIDYGYFYPIIYYTDSFNCKFSDTSKVEVKFFTIYIPNSFSPNEDGLNDIFDIKGEAIESYKLYIYNSWGQLIFKSQNEGWNGKSNNNLCQEGVYNYIVEINDIFGRYLEKKGNVVLIR